MLVIELLIAFTATAQRNPGPAEPVILCRIKDPSKVVPILRTDTSTAWYAEEVKEGRKPPEVKGVVTSDHLYPCSNWHGARVVFNSRDPLTVYYDNKSDPQFPDRHYADLEPPFYSNNIETYDRKDVRVYLDHTVRRKIQITNKIGVNFRNRDEMGDEYLDHVEAGDGKEIYVIDSAFVPDYEDPLQHRKEGRIFYHVDVVDPKTGRRSRGWIDSEAVSLTPVTAPLPPPEDCPDALEAEILSLRGSSAAAERQARETIKNYLKSKSCLSRQSGGLSFNAYRTEFAKAVEDRPGALRSLSVNELNAIDALARTMFGEMRGCHYERGPHYSMAVARVALNRAETAMRKNDSGFESFNVRGKPLSDGILSVLGRSAQFSAWNSGDKNRPAMSCIRGKNENDVFDQALEIAMDVVRDQSGFKSMTSQIPNDAYHYSSNTTPWWADGKQRLGNLSIGNDRLNSARCLIVWR